MSEFKVGDKVECIDGSATDFTLSEGNKYTIYAVDYRGIMLEETRQNGIYYSKRRFILIVDKPPGVNISRVGEIVKVEIVGSISKDKMKSILEIVYD